MNRSILRNSFLLFYVLMALSLSGQNTINDLAFTRQGVQRLVFSDDHYISLATLKPHNIVGLTSMHPIEHLSEIQANVSVKNGKLRIGSSQQTRTSCWLGGFNPFATYTINWDTFSGNGECGFEFTDLDRAEHFRLIVEAKNGLLTGVNYEVNKDGQNTRENAAINVKEEQILKGELILQMLGSGFVLYLKKEKTLPIPIAQGDFNKHIDLRAKKYIQTFHTNVFVKLEKGNVEINNAKIGFSTGVGQADIRVITYENGEPIIDDGKVWYTMSIRGRALPHHIQGVFSLNPSSFDINLEGVIVFDRSDGILRNEIASHIFYDRKEKIWRGLTTGFSAFAFPEKEKKQLLAIESKKDPRFGFTVMNAKPFGIVGDIEDPHIIYDDEVKKWRMLTCENVNKTGYKAIIMESDNWNSGYTKIAGPVEHNSTGTSIMKIGNKRYCFSGSSERKIFVYSYPDLKELEPLKMDLPPWDKNSGTRVWPNVIELPEGHFCRYIALMMDRYNYPGLKGPNWTYGALYLYHGHNFK